MAPLERGLYERLVTEALAAELGALPPELCAVERKLGGVEAAERIARHVAGVLQRTIDSVPDEERLELGINIARGVLALLMGGLEQTELQVVPLWQRVAQRTAGYATNQDPQQALIASDIRADLPSEPARVLRAVLGKNPDGSPRDIPAPYISLWDTTLLTNMKDEPRVGHHIATEIESADRIDLVMAFIRRTGLRPLLEALRRFTALGRPLRVLTTTYTGSTELLALEQLQALGAEVRVSYDTTCTRLHAKAWIFQRNSGCSTAYIGSSNLTHSAQIAGLEWNVRVSGTRNPEVLRKMSAMFESYWENGDFRPLDRAEFIALSAQQTPAGLAMLSPIEVRLEPFQERLLEQIAMARDQGRHRNLLVSATGTGKTVMAAVDYAGLRRHLKRCRLLFVAHRREILEQSLATFRHALRDPAFGELWVDGRKPDAFEHVFASVQSLARADLVHMAPDHFDVVVVDEFHHAAADSYVALLEHLRPRELLGLTATPERSDGLPILHHFHDQISAELRLWDAIDQHRLVPFFYFGIHDGVDLRDIPWKRGRGYDTESLTRVLTGSEHAARLVLAQLAKHVEDIQRIRALGFCVSIEHARFMARVFTDNGVRATAVWGDSPSGERAAALADLAAGRIQVLFSVDIFNEGVDLPTVDTLLLLRPTDSPTLFLQQLGRGLRRSPGKSACTVLDFVGLHRSEFRMDRRFLALFSGTRKSLVRDIEAGFPYLPAGCHFELDPVAREIVLANIRAAIPAHWKAKVAELRAMAAAAPSGDVSLAQYLEQSGQELEDIYSDGHGWSELRADAGLAVAAVGPREEKLRGACERLLRIDDMLRIAAYREFVRAQEPPSLSGLSVNRRRLLRMLVVSMVNDAAAKGWSFAEGTALLWEHPRILAELSELLDVLASRTTHQSHALHLEPDVPLRVHGRYTRIEILAAFGVGSDAAKSTPWREGVRWVPDAKADLLAFTLDKSDGSFTASTRYRDYAISRELIHWESQSTTSAKSETGLRYQGHAARGSQVMLFARHKKKDGAYYFLGPASYVSHRNERPMAITWRLQYPLPGDLYAAFAAAVA